MAWEPDYCTAAELKSWLRIADTVDDTLLGTAITSASRAIDGYCGRQFGSVSSGVVRWYEWDGLCRRGRDVLVVDDLYSVTDLAVALDQDGDGTTESTLTVDSDYELGPVNAPADGWPWTRLVLRPRAARWPRCPGAVKVTARWGWTSVPIPVKQATVLLAAELAARRNAPFGVAGSPEIGSELRLLARVDPDAVTALRRYVRAVPGGWAAA